ncbi:hypothetical protein [Streptomyces sp. PTD9-10]|uniref:hypothetical protein n=1 Tax=Streptomyces sp. PTD9-10 TaxID=3120151 RepID=UPI0030098233
MRESEAERLIDEAYEAWNAEEWLTAAGLPERVLAHHPDEKRSAVWWYDAAPAHKFLRNWAKAYEPGREAAARAPASSFEVLCACCSEGTHEQERTVHAAAQSVSLAAPGAEARRLLEQWAGEVLLGRSRSGLEPVSWRGRRSVSVRKIIPFVRLFRAASGLS